MRWLLLPAMLMVGPAWGQEGASPGLRGKLRARIVETLPPAAVAQPGEASLPPAAVAQPGEASKEWDGEPVLELEPMVITRDMEIDLLAEARRAVEAKKAAEFSLLRGGKLLSFRRGDIGFWPKIVPTDATPVKKADVALTVDLLRIRW